MSLDRGTEHDQNGHQSYDLCDGSWACRVQVRPIGAFHLYNVMPEMKEDPSYDEWRRTSDVEDSIRRLELLITRSRIRRFTMEEVLRELRDASCSLPTSDLLDRLDEGQSRTRAKTLTVVVQQLVEESNELKAPDQRRYDRVLARLLPKIPPVAALNVVRPFVDTRGRVVVTWRTASSGGRRSIPRLRTGSWLGTRRLTTNEFSRSSWARRIRPEPQISCHFCGSSTTATGK